MATASGKGRSAAPERPGATTAQLKDDIDSGRTGDKIAMFDPALAPLGTDDEAAGHPPSPAAIALARQDETQTRWRYGAATADIRSDRILYGFIAFIVLVAIVFVAAFWIA